MGQSDKCMHTLALCMVWQPMVGTVSEGCTADHKSCRLYLITYGAWRLFVCAEDPSIRRMSKTVNVSMHGYMYVCTTYMHTYNHACRYACMS